MEQVDSAEKEASEVLHSLLSVERLEKIDKHETFITTNENGQEVQWTTTPVLFTNEQYQQAIDEHQVIWEDNIEESPQLVSIYTNQQISNKADSEELIEEEEVEIIDEKKIKPKAPIRRPKIKSPLKKKKKSPNEVDEALYEANDPTKLETSAAQVKERFKRGCECQDERCFMGLNPETVYKHRLNIAELTKGEHDMYLMGVTMACLANPDTTVRQKERRRLRAQYVYQGRRVCLDAFLYLENCTHYQLKRIRKHVMTHGVAPRVHGNHGKKPHNTFSLDIYRHATEFLKQYMEQHTGAVGICSSKQPIQLPWDITRKNLHDAYKEYGQILEPGIKLMGYSTFRHFMKEQFPHVKFSKVEPKPPIPAAPTQPQSQPQNTPATQQSPPPPQTQVQVQTQPVNVPVPVPVGVETQNIQIQKCVISNDVQQVIPLVVAPDGGGSQPQAFIVTPVQQIINGNTAANTFSYQLTNGYVINEQGNIVTTMANAQHTPFTFSRI